jgi:arylsulfate sulfotransferase
MSLRLRLLLPTVVLCLAACGGGGGGTPPAEGGPPPSMHGETPSPGAGALQEGLAVLAVRQGPSPFIAFVDIQAPALGRMTLASFRIKAKPGTVSRPVAVSYSAKYLQQKGVLDLAGGRLTLPVFGLYANHDNEVEIELAEHDGSTGAVTAQVRTAAFTDPNGFYDHPTLLKARGGNVSLGLDFIYLKSGVTSPVVVDTDGQVRWMVPGPTTAIPSTFVGDGFLLGMPYRPVLQHIGLDGSVREFSPDRPDLTGFHHDIVPGKTGVLVGIDSNTDGVPSTESVLYELDPATGTVLKRWDMADIFSRYMRAHGDDPASFVRPGVDWFHLNSAIYDPADDTLLVSSREHFVVKIGYESADIRWLFGDPTKYWHGFASLAAKSIALAPGGLYPIGQHGLELTADGALQVFNNGQPSVNQPPGQPAGEGRSYSAVSVYAINQAGTAATEIRRFDYGRSIMSPFCSSAYATGVAGSLLIDYAVADNGKHARLVVIDGQQQVLFDLQYPNAGCGVAWNARPIHFEALHIR